MKTISPNFLEDLLHQSEPAQRFFALSKLMPENDENDEILKARIDLPHSKILAGLSSVPEGIGPYQKWQGAHWSLIQLADLGYPFINPHLEDLRDQVYEWLFSERHQKSIKTIAGRTRRCASQEGNAIYYSVCLNMVNDRTTELVSKLLTWQWPDGGWNCDKRPEAINSSFWESWTPLKGLLAWREYSGNDPKLDTAIERACEIFLKRKLFLSQKTNQVMQEEFLRLHHPSYWKYDILVGLELMQMAGKLTDPRLQPALDLLESKMLPDGGFPLEERFFQSSNPDGWHYSPVDWGNVSKNKSNFWVTVRALAVLIEAGRIGY